MANHHSREMAFASQHASLGSPPERRTALCLGVKGKKSEPLEFHSRLSTWAGTSNLLLQ